MLTLQNIADTVVRRAERQGYVVSRDIRQELREAGQPENHWKDVANLARASLNFRQGRYYHIRALSPRLQQEQVQQRLIRRTIRELIKHVRSSGHLKERRKQDRIDFVHPLRIEDEDGSRFTLLCRDVSATGIRLVGTKRLLGQKIRVTLPGKGSETTFQVRILWTCAISEDLFENGGTFMRVVERA
jgi:hypothetical protein